jgi:hypothetical protein
VRKTATFLTVAAALAVTTSAHASDGPYPVDTRAELGPYLPIARSAWPNSPCTGRERIAYATDIGANNGLDMDAASVPETCLVYMNPRMFVDSPQGRYMFCTLLTHEFGHLAGQVHSDDPNNIMHSPTPSYYQPCMDLAGITYQRPPDQISLWPKTPKPEPRKKCRQKTAKARRACRTKHP